MYMWMRMTFDHVWWGAKHSPMRSVPDINVWEHNPEPCIKGWGNPKINHGIGQAHRPRLTFLTVAISDNLPSHHDEWVDVCVFILVCVCVIGGYDVYDHITCFVHLCGHFLSLLVCFVRSHETTIVSKVPRNCNHGLMCKRINPAWDNSSVFLPSTEM